MFTRTEAPQSILHKSSYNENLVYIKTQIVFAGQPNAVNSNKLFDIITLKMGRKAKIN